MSDQTCRTSPQVRIWEANAQPSLEYLMELYQQADGEATAKLIGVLAPILYRFLASQLGSRLGAEDLLQEVFLKIHQSRHTYRANQPLLPWVFAIARHVRVSDYHKRCRASRREMAIDEMPQRINNPEFFRRAPPELSTLLSGLPDSQREVLVMLKVNEFSLKDVAKVTSSTVGAVKQKAHRAYEKLRFLLAE